MLQDFLLFGAKNKLYAMSTSRITEIVRTGAVRKVPNQKAPLMGFSLIRNRTVSVFDIHTLLHPQSSGEIRDYTLLVNVNKGLSRETVAILVDNVNTMVHIQHSAILPAPNLLDKQFKRVIAHNNENYWLIEDDIMLSSLHAELAAA